jgi:hypothetical protein
MRVAIAALLLLAYAPASLAQQPRLLKFRATDRIATGKVARYDLREESRAFEYRIAAERVEVVTFKRDGKRWRRIGRVKATPPRPLNLWPVFRSMGNGTYRLTARAVNGSGDDREQSLPRNIRFRVVSHIPHAD